MKLRKTPLYYLVLILSIIGLPYGIYGLSLPGWEQLIGYAALAAVLAMLVALVLEQFLLRRFTPGVGGVLLIDASILAGMWSIISLMMAY